MKSLNFHTSNKHPVAILLPILISLTIIISSCSFNVPAVDPAKRQTDVSRSVDSTLNAEKVATYQVQQTLDAAQPVATQPESPNTNATMQAQQATLDAQSTSLSPQITQPAPTDTPQVTPSLASAASLDPVQILDWKLVYWFYLPNGCRAGAPCWRTDDDYKKHLGLSPMVLTSKQSYLIDPNWPKPYLMFWNKRRNTSPAAIDLIIDGTPIGIKQYPKGQIEWSTDAIDLSNYKGKEIIIRFSVSGKWGSGTPGSEWYLEDIRIVPNYKP